MVKRPLIAKKPEPIASPSADSWVNSGGIDPEIQSVVTPEVEVAATPTAATAVEPKLEPDSPEKQFPHRISFDMSKEQYKRLKLASFQLERPMNEILRDAVETCLQSSGY